MTRNEDIYYLDTSALVKRYVEEPGSDILDNVFSECYRGTCKISLSYWNIAEAAIVFDKYERKAGLDAKKLLQNLLREMRTLAKLHRVILVDVSPRVLRKSIEIALKHHIYIADALQIASAYRANTISFMTGDRELAGIAEKENLKVLYVG